MFKLMFFSGQKKNFLIAGFLIGALVLTIGIAQKPTQIRQNAAEITSPPLPPVGNVTLALLSPSTQIPANSQVDAEIFLDAADQKVTGLSFDIVTNDSAIIKPTSIFLDQTIFNNLLRNDMSDTIYHYTAVDTIGKTITGRVKIGTITLSTKNAGYADIRFQNVQATAIDIAGFLNNQQNVNLQLTVVSAALLAPIATVTTNTPNHSMPTTCNAPCDADLNKDGRVSGLDYSISVTCFKKPLDTTIRSGIMCSLADINKDNKIDDTDVDCIKTQFGKSCEIPATITTIPPTSTPSGPVPGDATGDGFVNILDYNRWKDEYLGALTTKTADFNKDGKVDFIDFSIFRNAFKPGI